ncbi:hypothetical protein Taro_049689 [Colocasia esculenta]|uniref:AP2/ERF domain-containing protein n=1 Tax=Colocasia esculenta TaxID=4460 RepID=A0A843XBG0_COLES|nr:hypothetical protein [Colocasia esculenta]
MDSKDDYMERCSRRPGLRPRSRREWGPRPGPTQSAAIHVRARAHESSRQVSCAPKVLYGDGAPLGDDKKPIGPWAPPPASGETFRSCATLHFSAPLATARAVKIRTAFSLGTAIPAVHVSVSTRSDFAVYIAVESRHPPPHLSFSPRSALCSHCPISSSAAPRTPPAKPMRTPEMARANAATAAAGEAEERRNTRFKGVRKRKWGKWVSEIRLPHSRERIWLGSYDTPEKAAHAFDAAMLCLRGPGAGRFNFPDNLPDIAAAGGRNFSPSEVQAAAYRFAKEASAEAPPPMAGPGHPQLGSPEVAASDGTLTGESGEELDWSFLLDYEGPSSSHSAPNGLDFMGTFDFDHFPSEYFPVPGTTTTAPADHFMDDGGAAGFNQPSSLIFSALWGKRPVNRFCRFQSAAARSRIDDEAATVLLHAQHIMNSYRNSSTAKWRVEVEEICSQKLARVPSNFPTLTDTTMAIITKSTCKFDYYSEKGSLPR